MVELVRLDFLVEVVVLVEGCWWVWILIVGPITCVLSNQFRNHVILPLEGFCSLHFSSPNISESLFLTSLSPPPSHFVYTPFPTAFEMIK